MRALVYLLFFLSGACGLVYEVVWSRLLSEVFGSTVLAIGTILAAFMSGLALGGYVLGRRADRSTNPLRLYAIYELGIGVAALLATWLMGQMTSVYVWLHSWMGQWEILLAGARFVIAFALVVAPTFLMGATLPILARFVISRLAAVGSSLSSLYALNTVGAVAGSLLAGFVLIGRFGIYGSVFLAVAGNLAIGAVAWIASNRELEATEGEERIEEEPAPELEVSDRKGREPALRLLLWAFALSGFTSFSYEIFWTRSLVHLLGNSTYAFTLMLVAFLSGLALGGYLIRFALQRLTDGFRWFGWLQISIGLSAAAAMPLLFSIVDSPAFKEFLSGMANRLGPLMFSQFAVALLVMLMPATLIGATFPLVGSIYVKDLQRTGADVGKVYAVNTLGNVLGALAPAVFLIPIYGIQRAVVLIAVLNVCLGLFILLSRSEKAGAFRWVTLAVVLGVAAVLPQLSFGFQFPSQAQSPEDRVLYYREGLIGTTKVYENLETGDKRMSIDGIIIGGTEFTDYKQQILAHFPKLLVKEYRSELSIGLGSAILIGESLRHPQLERLVAVEIEPSVLEGAEYFAAESYGVLEDPRLEVVIDDVGNFLRTSDEKFDLVSADEKTADKYASNGFSYSSDYYELLREHLTPHGLVMQWIPNHLPPSQYRMVLKTFAASFPEVTLWYFPAVGKGGPMNTIVTGSLAPPVLDLDWMNRELEIEAVAFAGIRKYGIETGEAVLAQYVADGDAVMSATEGVRLNTLEHPYYEFYSPREYAPSVNERTFESHRLLWELRRRHGLRDLERRLQGGAPLARLREAFAAQNDFLMGLERQLTARPHPEIAGHLDRAMSLASWNRNLRAQILTYLWSVGGTLYLQGNYRDALYFMGQAASIFPTNGEVRYYHGLALLKNGDKEGAIREMAAAIELNSRLLAPRRHLTTMYLEAGAYDRAAAQVDAILAIDPKDEFALSMEPAPQ